MVSAWCSRCLARGDDLERAASWRRVADHGLRDLCGEPGGCVRGVDVIAQRDGCATEDFLSPARSRLHLLLDRRDLHAVWIGVLADGRRLLAAGRLVDRRVRGIRFQGRACSPRARYFDVDLHRASLVADCRGAGAAAFGSGG